MPLAKVEDVFGFTTVIRKRTRRDHDRAIEAMKLLPPVPAEPINHPTVYTTRHDFSPPLIFLRYDRADRLLDIAKNDLHDYNLSTFKTFVNPLDISPLTDAIHPLQESMPNIRLYAVGRIPGDRRGGFMAKVPLYSSHEENGDIRVMVLEGERSRPFTEWLSASARPDAATPVDKTGYELQYKWWRKRRGHFNYPGLPLDLKKMLLLHMAGEVRHYDRDGFGRYSFRLEHDFHSLQSELNDYRYWHAVNPTRIPSIEALDPGLFTLNKDTNADLRKVVDYWTIKHISCPNDLPVVVQKPQSKILEFLSRVQLDFTDAEYFAFFDARLPDLDSHDGEAVELAGAEAIAALPSLKYLELWFNSTINAQKYRCRKHSVDWIMRFAYRYVKNVKSVNLTGYIKTVTRVKWLQILKDKPNIEKHQARIDDEIAQVQKDPTEFLEQSRQCGCPHTCQYNGFVRAEDIQDNDPMRHNESIFQSRCRRLKIGAQGYWFDFDDADRSRLEEAPASW